MRGPCPSAWEHSAVHTYGARESVTNLQGETPLHIAARCRTYNTIKLLVDAGANTHTPDIFGRTPVHSLIVADRLTLMREMPRKWECVFDMMDVIIIDGLIQIEGININAVDNNGTTVIHECVRSGLEITRDLIHKGVDIYVINHSHETPLI